MNQKERHIREIAHRLWELEGRPHGHSDRFWFLAIEEYEAEIVPAREEPPAIETAPKKQAPAESKAEKVEAEKPAAKHSAISPAAAKAHEDAPAKASQSEAAKPKASQSEAAKPKAPAKRK